MTFRRLRTRSARTGPKSEPKAPRTTAWLSFVADKMQTGRESSLTDLRVRIIHAHEDVRHSTRQRDRAKDDLIKAHTATTQSKEYLDTITAQAELTQQLIDAAQASIAQDRLPVPSKA